MKYMPQQQKYIESVDGQAHQSAVEIIGLLEKTIQGMWVLVASLENEIDSICAKWMEK